MKLHESDQAFFPRHLLQNAGYDSYTKFIQHPVLARQVDEPFRRWTTQVHHQTGVGLGVVRGTVGLVQNDAFVACEDEGAKKP